MCLLFLIALSKSPCFYGSVSYNYTLFVSRGYSSKLFISWVGLRGAVPIVLATFPLLAHSTDSTFIFDLVFFIVLASVLLQGTTISPVAKWLGVVDDLSPEKVAAS